MVQGPRTRHQGRRRRDIARLVAAAALGGLGAMHVADARPPNSPRDASEARRWPAQPGQPSLATREFAATRLPVPVLNGPLEFTGTQVAAWTEPAPDGRVVTRLVLRGDVSALLGLYRMEAQRAAAWIAPLPPGDPDAGPEVYQVFVYFEGVGTPEEDAAVALTADRLTVQGIFRVPRPVVLKEDLRIEPRPNDALVREAERRLSAYLRRVAEGEQPARDLAQIVPGEELAPEPAADQPAPAEEDPVARRVAAAANRLGPTARDEPIFARSGLFTVAAGDVVMTTGPEERVATVMSDERGPVTVVYWDAERNETLQLTAERAVIFLEPGDAPGEAQFSAEQVRGIYLEGDVYADNGRYRLRSPRVFYSVKDDRAVLIDAVFWTHDAFRGLPLYVRAKRIEQLSQDQFRARGARLTNTAFLDPGLSLGATSVTIGPPRREGQGPYLDVRNLTVRVAGLPVMWFPRYRGDPSAIPLRHISLEMSSSRGAGIKTGWNAETLLGLNLPPGHTMDLLADYYFERGPALGMDWQWLRDRAEGGAAFYTLPYDAGRDLTSTGRTVERSGDFRMLAQAEHRAKVGERGEVWAQGFWVSDATFVDAWFDNLARNRREFENSIFAKRNGARASLTAEVKTNFVDFIPNEYLLQSQGYTVQRVPEFTYSRVADDLLAAAAPGLLTYTSEYRLGRVAFEFDEETAAERGFVTPAQSQALFGILPTQSPADALRAQGLNTETVTRFDTRHELSSQLRTGPFSVTPFAVGRVTAWDRSFESYSPDADKLRWWSSAGAEVSTEIARVNNNVHSRLFDLHRTRHVVTPRMAAWTAHTSVEREDLPNYDEHVESIAEGDVVRLALEQTWQTYRGGPGRSRSVDVFTLDAEVIFSDNTGPARSPIQRWIGYRPEQSSLGDFAALQSTWQVSEVVALAADTVFDLNSKQQDRTSVGGIIQHSPDFSTFAELRYLNSQDQTFADFGVQYILTPKYSLAGFASYDTLRGRFQVLGAEVRRAFPNVWIGAAVSYNDINENASLGIVLTPRLPGVTGSVSGSRFGAGFGGQRSPLLGG